tara:strand:+ start:47 stop:742 length:696 start_codon:yes stop_codon:yes gene_type:complete
MFSIVIPVFNEEENIVNLTQEIINSCKKFKSYEIVFVDDFSNDNSLQKILKLQKKYNHIKIIKNKKNKGQSFSIANGIEKSKYSTIITLDGDGQNNPKDIPKLIKIFNDNLNINFVGGIRQKRKDNLIKILSSKIANSVRSKYLNDNCIDTGCSLKIFEKQAFQNFPYFNGMHRFLPALFKGFGYKTTFVNVDHRKRKFGKSKYGTIDRLIRGINDMRLVKKIINEQEQNN